MVFFTILLTKSNRFSSKNAKTPESVPPGNLVTLLAVTRLASPGKNKTKTKRANWREKETLDRHENFMWKSLFLTMSSSKSLLIN